MRALFSIFFIGWLIKTENADVGLLNGEIPVIILFVMVEKKNYRIDYDETVPNLRPKSRKLRLLVQNFFSVRSTTYVL